MTTKPANGRGASLSGSAVPTFRGASVFDELRSQQHQDALDMATPLFPAGEPATNTHCTMPGHYR